MLHALHQQIVACVYIHAYYVVAVKSEHTHTHIYEVYARARKRIINTL